MSADGLIDFVLTIDVIVLMYGDLEVRDAETFALARKDFCERMRAEVPDEAAAKRYVEAYSNAVSMGETENWIENNSPIVFGVRKLVAAVCSLNGNADDAARLITSLDTLYKVYLSDVQNYPTSPAVRDCLIRDFRLALGGVNYMLSQNGRLEQQVLI